MPIFHNRKKDNFTSIDNRILNNKKLSWKAKGILCYLLSLPEDWDVHWTEISTHAADGKTSFKSGIKELKKAGFIKHEKKKDNEGKFKHNYYIYEYPSNNPDTDYPDPENPGLDNPAPENPQLLITYLLMTYRTKDTLNNNKPSKEEKSDIPYQKIKEMYNNICKSIPSIRKMTDSRRKHIRARWKEEQNIDIFKEVFEKVENSSFLIGGNDRNWKVDFDWIIKNDTNFNKILEGKYNDENIGSPDVSEEERIQKNLKKQQERLNNYDYSDGD